MSGTAQAEQAGQAAVGSVCVGAHVETMRGAERPVTSDRAPSKSAEDFRS